MPSSIGDGGGEGGVGCGDETHEWLVGSEIQ